MIKEIQPKYASGYLALVVLPGLLIADIWLFVKALQTVNVGLILVAVLFAIVLIVCLMGFFMVHPNQARVLTLFGTYVGSARDTGLRWANPFYAKKSVSLRLTTTSASSKFSQRPRSGTWPLVIPMSHTAKIKSP